MTNRQLIVHKYSTACVTTVIQALVKRYGLSNESGVSNETYSEVRRLMDCYVAEMTEHAMKGSLDKELHY